MNNFSLIGQIDTFESNSDEYITRYYRVFAEGEEEAHDILRRNGVVPEGQRCGHDYDCCGNWYPRPVWTIARMETTGRDFAEFIFRQDFSRNV